MGKQNQNFNTIFLHFVFPVLVMAGCDTFRQVQKKQAWGFYGLTGWNAALIDTNTNEAAAIDINGKVGYVLSVSPPAAQCVSKNRKWTSDYKILSGKLPPGLEFDKSNRIIGVPRQRGRWILKVELNNIGCNDSNYKSMNQEIRFHIASNPGEI